MHIRRMVKLYFLLLEMGSHARMHQYTKIHSLAGVERIETMKRNLASLIIFLK